MTPPKIFVVVRVDYTIFMPLETIYDCSNCRRWNKNWRKWDLKQDVLFRKPTNRKVGLFLEPTPSPTTTAKMDDHKNLIFDGNSHLVVGFGITNVIFDMLPLSRVMGVGARGTPKEWKNGQKFCFNFLNILTKLDSTCHKSLVMSYLTHVWSLFLWFFGIIDHSGTP